MSASARPLFSIVTPVYDPPIDVLTDTLESVLAQTFDGWEMVCVDDLSPNAEVRTVLRRFAQRDPRIRVIERSANGNIVVASNDGLAAARGEFVVLLDHDDLLVPRALARVARAIKAEPTVDFLYSDEDKYDGERFYDRFSKPAWAPERLRSQNYLNHLSVLRTSLVTEVGGFRDGFDGSQDHDLFLRVTERARAVVHIPEVLYHWRAVAGSVAADVDAKPTAYDAGRRAVADHLERIGVQGDVEVSGPGRYRVRRCLDRSIRVSIVIPTIGSDSMVWGRRRVHVVEAVRSMLAHTSHEDLEVVVVYDPPTPQRVLDELTEILGHRLVLVPFHEKFNYSRKTNLGVLASTGERLVLLNDDIEVRSAEWLDELLAPLDDPGVALVGGRLMFSSDTVQHAGLSFNRGNYHHIYRGFPADAVGMFGDLVITREVDGVTGACVGVRRETYLELGGLPEELPGSFNDVDLSYKARKLGYRILYTPHCLLFHFESISREPQVKAFEIRFIRSRWGTDRRDEYTRVFPEAPKPVARRKPSRR
ncbi:glycosyltransferase [Nocardioides carbamazepini]|uniref:glycosyltransferase n=1 Tax=Nocardioides carbamazepini TaxID=2854259 RepID=UPI002149FF7E|nr:glycosyltransferase [Nocardioides carbamazepini]MCR1782666.1 glycosyltransferase [Nocardioides carbamazepini]